jgi:hypothetical protein
VVKGRTVYHIALKRGGGFTLHLISKRGLNLRDFLELRRKTKMLLDQEKLVQSVRAHRRELPRHGLPLIG